MIVRTWLGWLLLIGALALVDEAEARPGRGPTFGDAPRAGQPGGSKSKPGGTTWGSPRDADWSSKPSFAAPWSAGGSGPPRPNPSHWGRPPAPPPPRGGSLGEYFFFLLVGAGAGGLAVWAGSAWRRREECEWVARAGDAAAAPPGGRARLRSPLPGSQADR